MSGSFKGRIYLSCIDCETHNLCLTIIATSHPSRHQHGGVRSPDGGGTLRGRVRIRIRDSAPPYTVRPADGPDVGHIWGRCTCHLLPFRLLVRVHLLPCLHRRLHLLRRLFFRHCPGLPPTGPSGRPMLSPMESVPTREK